MHVASAQKDNKVHVHVSQYFYRPCTCTCMCTVVSRVLLEFCISDFFKLPIVSNLRLHPWGWTSVIVKLTCPVGECEEGAL